MDRQSGRQAPVIITGAASGVGAATARWFAARGHPVLINYRSRAAEAEAVLADCLAAGVEAMLVAGDVASDADCRRITAATADRWGHVGILVNNAARTLFRPMADLDALDAADFVDLYTVNVVGPYQMARATVPHMRPGSAIVNVSSLAAQQGTGSSHAYAASKGALNTLTLSLARTLAPDIRVNAVLPGLIDSDWVSSRIGEEGYARARESYIAGAALGIVATPEQVAQTVGWLATGAEIVTGQLFVADAGTSLGGAPRLQ